MKTSNCCDTFVNPDLMICSDCKEHCGYGEDNAPVEEWEKEFERVFVRTNWAGTKCLNQIFITEKTKQDPIIEKEEIVLVKIKQFIKDTLRKERDRMVREIIEYRDSLPDFNENGELDTYYNAQTNACENIIKLIQK